MMGHGPLVSKFACVTYNDNIRTMLIFYSLNYPALFDNYYNTRMKMLISSILSLLDNGALGTRHKTVKQIVNVNPGYKVCQLRAKL